MPRPTAILVEEDYKGEYTRFALTPEAFARQYPKSPPPSAEGGADTLHPLIHIWYRETTAGSHLWHDFFRDMYWGLSEGDVEDGNAAHIDFNAISPILLDFVLQTIHPRSISPAVAAEYRHIATMLESEDCCDMHGEAAMAIEHLLALLRA